MLFCSKVLPGPLGPHLPRGKLEANSRIGRYIFEIFMLKIIFGGKLIFYHFDFRKWILQIVFVQKSIIPPLRTKPYYSKPKWRSRRLKSLKMPQNVHFHLFAPKSPFCSKSEFWVHFCILEHFLHFWLQMAKKGIKKPLLPQAFERLVPKNAFWTSKCAKCWKGAGNHIFSEFI